MQRRSPEELSELISQHYYGDFYDLLKIVLFDLEELTPNAIICEYEMVKFVYVNSNMDNIEFTIYEDDYHADSCVTYYEDGEQEYDYEKSNISDFIIEKLRDLGIN